VRWQAARALESLGWAPDDKRSAARFAVAIGKIEEAAAYGPDAVEALSLVLQDGAYHQRREAVASLSNIADARVIKALLLALRDADDQVRGAAVEALCKIGDPASAEALIIALRDPHKQVRAMAAEALGRFGGARGIEPLLGLIRDKHWEVREAVCLALGRLRATRAFDLLVGALKDGDREVREAAIRGLTQLGDQRAIQPMISALVDDHDSVRQLASVGLSTLDMHWEKTEAARAAMPVLQEALKHSQYWVRQSAADGLARIGSMTTAAPKPATVTTTAEGTPALIEPAHFRKQTTVQVMVELLHDFDHELRHAAAEALGRLGQPGALAPLTHTLTDADRGVRRAAAAAIETLRGKPTSETELILRGEDFPL
jgi:HEAT repeat protein